VAETEVGARTGSDDAGAAAIVMHAAASANDRAQRHLELALDADSPQQYLRATRHEPHDELERRLLRLSNSYYSLIVATVEAWFADEDRVGGVLRGRAMSLMDGLNEINGFLVERGLMPQFTQLGEAQSASPSP
jgi:hypothetical protein